MLKLISLLISVIFVSACGGGGGSDDSGTPAPNVPAGSNSVLVSWTANPDTAVNSAGGGYRVYYSATQGFSISAGAVKDVPFVSGTAPTSTTITGLGDTTFYFKVVAYSAIVPPGGSSGATSSPSNEFSVNLQ